MATNIYQKAASFIAKAEGRKSQARIADIREILKILKEEHFVALAENRVSHLLALLENAQIAAVKRLQKEGKKKA
jgi:hypothetical protein